ncbi:Hsp70 family protein [Polycladidibacter hongkongensis]|uniref:Hsp70 family protein n=1 Tax=Polycladidibacter hongkongensis TaxID=1647556 RepID=UPI000830F967|nr:Hsp70 family protein [Pseudovibrio hongkongensis]
MQDCLGLDFGTTNSVITRPFADGSATPISYTRGGPTYENFRSALSYENRGGRMHSEGGPFAIARYLELMEESRFIQSFKTFAASKLFQGTFIGGRPVGFEQLMSDLIGHMLAAGVGLEHPLPKRVVVGRPVEFAGASVDEALAMQRYSDGLAALGFEEVLFVYEPVAAAFFYAQQLQSDALVLVADFGGGTSDFSLMHFSGAGGELRATPVAQGGVGIGGDTFDYRLVENVVLPRLGKGGTYKNMGKELPLPSGYFSQFAKWNLLSVFRSSDMFKDIKRTIRYATEPEKLEMLVELVEEEQGYPLYLAVSDVKAALSQQEEADFCFNPLGMELSAKITRAEFEHWIAPDIARIEQAMDDTLLRGGVARKDVDVVFLTGGSSRIPAIKQAFAGYFGAERVASGDELVSIANGLAIIGAREDAGKFAVDAQRMRQSV